MPTDKPRFTITLEPEVHETIQTLARLQGRSRGAVVSDLLEGVHLPLQKTVKLLVAAQSAPAELQKGLFDTLTGLEEELQGSYSDAMGKMDSATEVASGFGGAPTGEAPNPRPPSSNRGVRSTTTPTPNTHKPKKTKGKGS